MDPLPTFISFDYRDKVLGGENLGRAEFLVCLKWKKGKIVEFWVDPVQTRLYYKWHFIGGNEYGDFSVDSYEQLDAPRVWFFTFCKQHKTQAFRVYAPNDAKFLEISESGLNFWKSNLGGL